MLLVPSLSWPGDIIWDQQTILLIGGIAIAVAMVGLIESLMTLQLIDDMTETRGQGNRECLAQGGAKHVRLMPIDIEPGVRVYSLQGVLYFGSVREFSERLSPANDPDEVIIDFMDARVADYSSLEALNAITERYRNAGKTLRMRHLSTECQKMITAAGSLVEIEVADDDPHYSVASI